MAKNKKRLIDLLQEKIDNIKDNMLKGLVLEGEKINALTLWKRWKEKHRLGEGKPQGKSCSDASDCPDGEICKNGECQSPTVDPKRGKNIEEQWVSPNVTLSDTCDVSDMDAANIFWTQQGGLFPLGMEFNTSEACEFLLSGAWIMTPGGTYPSGTEQQLNSFCLEGGPVELAPGPSDNLLPVTPLGGALMQMSPTEHCALCQCYVGVGLSPFGEIEPDEQDEDSNPWENIILGCTDENAENYNPQAYCCPHPGGGVIPGIDQDGNPFDNPCHDIAGSCCEYVDDPVAPDKPDKPSTDSFGSPVSPAGSGPSKPTKPFTDSSGNPVSPVGSGPGSRIDMGGQFPGPKGSRKKSLRESLQRLAGLRPLYEQVSDWDECQSIASAEGWSFDEASSQCCAKCNTVVETDQCWEFCTTDLTDADNCCRVEEPCEEPEEGCPEGFTWNTSTCHCDDPSFSTDDPCDFFWSSTFIAAGAQQRDNVCSACDDGTPSPYQAQFCDCCEVACYGCVKGSPVGYKFPYNKGCPEGWVTDWTTLDCDEDVQSMPADPGKLTGRRVKKGI